MSLYRGCSVVYTPRGSSTPEIFFYQPNGSGCHLYRQEKLIGNIPMAAYHPAKKSVRLATEKEIKNEQMPILPLPAIVPIEVCLPPLDKVPKTDQIEAVPIKTVDVISQVTDIITTLSDTVINFISSFF